MSNLDEIIEKAERKVDAFYQRAVSLHNNMKIRSITSFGIPIVAGEFFPRLYYGSEGFYTITSKCIEPGNAWENGVYEHPSYTFQERDGRLYVDTHDGIEEMLPMFPSLNTNTLEQKFSEGIKSSTLYKDN